MKEKLTEKLREVNLDLKKFPHLKGLNLANGIGEWATTGSDSGSPCTQALNDLLPSLEKASSHSEPILEKMAQRLPLRAEHSEKMENPNERRSHGKNCSHQGRQFVQECLGDRTDSGHSSVQGRTSEKRHGQDFDLTTSTCCTKTCFVRKLLNSFGIRVQKTEKRFLGIGICPDHHFLRNKECEAKTSP